ncbi:site-2 protease family protein [Jeotgalibacillus terrae]|uniref:Site-2 protease family protein n=1 Tax=Jeotgalibacillus terrae TaxID=587735 RepID=A0ABW5ZIZ4_9BACL|nr:site-2 protease family protein [Jeotgalibacillus terrae]MBM7578823.1 stage IV sporulation protein FB [Jeotgalibacillus terrae]
MMLIKGKVAIHPFFWIMAAASFISGQFHSFFILFILVLAHEAAHGIAAVFFKWQVKSLTLLPFGGHLEVKGILNKPVTEEAVVALSGPFFHLLVHICLIYSHLPFAYTEELIHLNLQLLFFNLLPVWPLDGGRILSCIINLFFPFKKSLYLLITFSTCTLLTLMIASVWQLQLQWLLLLVYAGFSTWQLYATRHFLFKQFLLEKWKVQHSERKIEYAPATDSLHSLVNRMVKGKKQQFLITENEKVIGTLSDDMIIKRYFSAHD